MELTQFEAKHKELCLGIDPGETTGIALMKWPNLLGSTQTKNNLHETTEHIRKIIEKYHPRVIVVEDYRVYPWKLRQHIGSSLVTVRLIGAIQYMAYLAHTDKYPLRFVLQGAHKAKFIEDRWLQKNGFYRVGNKHANDAIRHVVSYALFGKAPKGA